MMIPKDEVDNRINDYRWKSKGNIEHDRGLIYRDKLEIMKTYQVIMRGIIQYFALGNNLNQLIKLSYYAEYSCLKTLAAKK